MKTNYVVLAHFASAETLRKALHGLPKQEPARVELFLPFPDSALEEELYQSRSAGPVRIFVLLGGIAGCLLAFLVSAWMSIDYPLALGAKPLISIPAFIVVAFECTVLFAAVAGVFGMCLFSGIPSFAYFPQ